MPQEPPPWNKENGVEDWLNGIRVRLVSPKPLALNSKAAIIHALWPDIEQALREGQTLRAVTALLVEQGLQISYGCLASYLSRLRARNVNRGHVRPSDTPAAQQMTSRPESQLNDDPLAKVRERIKNPSGFEYRPGVEEEKLI